MGNDPGRAAAIPSASDLVNLRASIAAPSVYFIISCSPFPNNLVRSSYPFPTGACPGESTSVIELNELVLACFFRRAQAPLSWAIASKIDSD